MPTSTATGFKFFSFLRTKALKAFSDLQCEKAENDGLKIAVIHNYASVSKGKCPEVLRNIGNHLLAYHYKDGKAEIADQQMAIIKLAAQMWASENKNIISKIDSCSSITLGFLKEQGYIDNDIKNPATNEKIKDSLYINIKKNNSSYSYEIEGKNTTQCDALEIGEI